MENYYIKNEYSLLNLVNISAEIESQLREVGSLYEGEIPEQPTDYQKQCMKLNSEGHSYDDQIFSCYTELGGIQQAMLELSS